MKGRGKKTGSRVLVTVLMTLGSIIATAPAALAHGDHGAAPAALFEEVGPYEVSVWVEEFADGRSASNAIIESSANTQAPDVWLDTIQGREALGDLVDHGDGTWTVSFGSTVGDTFIVGWQSTEGPQEAAFALAPIPAPWWFKAILLLVTVPGLWFVYWMMKRRRRAFGLVPLTA